MSAAFLSMCVGYVTAALCNSLLHYHYGQRGVAFVAPLSQLLAYLIILFHPPYPVLPVVMTFSGFGGGLMDSAWNAWIGNMENANELMGILHGAYGVGATVAPLIATAMITKAELPWYRFYWLMAAAAALEFVLLVPSFRHADGATYRAKHMYELGQDRTTTRRVLREPITWLVSFFLLGYTGVEVAISGWTVSFMLEVRHADQFPAGMAAMGFWLGLTVGRLTLGFITGRIGEKVTITAYILLTIGLELMYWFIPKIIASSIIVAFMGFFLGPLFPGAVIAATKLLPSDFHISAIGFAASFGSAGAALLPFAVGVIAEYEGIGVLQPIILAMLTFILVLWCLVPGGLRRGGLERARQNDEKIGHNIKLFWAATREKFT